MAKSNLEIESEDDLFQQMSALADEVLDMLKAEKKRSQILRKALKEIVLMPIHNQETASRAKYVAIKAVKTTALKEWPPEVVKAIEENWKI